MKKIFIVIVLCAFTQHTIPAVLASGTASMGIIPSKDQAAVGEQFKLDVYVYPHTEKIDTVRAELSFPADLLSVEAIAKNSSYNFTSGGNSLDNNKGQLSFGAGISGGTEKNNRFLSLTLKAKKEGNANISLKSNTLILGGGMDLFNGHGATISIKIVSKSKSAAKVAAVKTYPDGTLIRNLANKKVYLVISQALKPISNLVELRKYAGVPIINVDEDVFLQYPDYGSSNFLNAAYGDGNLLKNNINKKIYVIGGGSKKLLASPADLKKYPNMPIYAVGADVLDKYKDAKTVSFGKKPYRDGSVLKDKNTGIYYLVEKGRKRSIASAKDRKNKKIYDVDSVTLSKYPLIF